MGQLDTEVLVAGAGPVGLMLAGELLRHGVSCRIVDKLPEASPYCRALGFQARTLELFDMLGLAERAQELGVRMRAANTWKDGQLAQRATLDLEPTAEVPYPIFLSLEQNLTEKILNEHLERLGGRVERSVALTDFTQDADTVTATLSTPQGPTTVTARYLVSCEGAHSVVRKKNGISYEGEPYPGTYMLADVDVEGPLTPEESHRFSRGDEILVAIPMPGDHRFRLSTKEKEAPASEADAPEHGLISGESHPPTAEEMQDAVDRVTGLPIRIVHCRWTSRYRISRRLAGRYRQGRTFLAGDAAHIHPPTGGQGMNTGLQDAWNLGWKLAMAVRHGGGEALLDSYEAERHAIAEGVLFRTDQAMKTANPFTGTDEEESRRKLLQLAQLDLHYRGTPCVEQHGPDLERLALQAGDRAPDGVLVQGDTRRRLFELFREPGYHLLLFGRDRAMQDLAEHVGRSFPGRLHAHFVAEGAWSDPEGAVAASYGARDGVVLVRPDGYVGFRSDAPNANRILAYLGKVLGGDLTGSRR